jgi:hypothetical protein
MNAIESLARQKSELVLEELVRGLSDQVATEALRMFVSRVAKEKGDRDNESLKLLEYYLAGIKALKDADERLTDHMSEGVKDRDARLGLHYDRLKRLYDEINVRPGADEGFPTATVNRVQNEMLKTVAYFSEGWADATDRLAYLFYSSDIGDRFGEFTKMAREHFAHLPYAVAYRYLCHISDLTVSTGPSEQSKRSLVRFLLGSLLRHQDDEVEKNTDFAHLLYALLPAESSAREIVIGYAKRLGEASRVGQELVKSLNVRLFTWALRDLVLTCELNGDLNLTGSLVYVDCPVLPTKTKRQEARNDRLQRIAEVVTKWRETTEYQGKVHAIFTDLMHEPGNDGYIRKVY